MSRLKLAASALAIAGLLLADIASAQVQRTFVASYGNDANAATNCGFTNPCRGFTAAHAVTVSGGEIVALDAAGYGAITITQSITITSNSGFYAGISASTGNAVTIATAGIKVVLRGLNINGIGAANGIAMTTAGALIVENCVISNFTGNGIVVSSQAGIAHLRVSNSVLRGMGGSGGTAAILVQENVKADISNTKILNNGYVGIWAFPQNAGNAIVSVSDSVLSGNLYGVSAVGTTTTSRITISRSTATLSGFYGVGTEGGFVSIGYSMVTANGSGLENSSGTLESLGNNIVRQNNANTSGTITTFAGT